MNHLILLIFLFYFSQTAFGAQPQIVSGSSWGNEYIHVLKPDGTVWGWGTNSQGELGDDSGASQSNPVQVKNISGISHLADCSALECFSLAVKADGTVWIWGTGAGHSLGDNVNADRLAPIQVPNLSGVITGDVGYQTAIAVRNDGTAWVWGWGNNIPSGLIIDDSVIYSEITTPTIVPGLANIIQVALGDNHAIALKSDGSVWTWGNNQSGQLGRPTTQQWNNLPARVEGVEDVVAIEAGGNHSIALKADGTLWAWGENQQGQVGDGGFANRFEPRQVVGLSNIENINAGYDYSLAIRSDGIAWSWGSSSAIPLQIEGLPAMFDISGNRSQIFGLSQMGEIWSALPWGTTLGERTVEPFTVGTIPTDFLPASCRAFYFTDGRLVLPCMDAYAAGLEPPIFDITLNQLGNSLQFQLTKATSIAEPSIASSKDCMPTFSNNVLDMPCTVVMHPSFGLQNAFHVKMNLLNENFIFEVQEIQ